MKAKELIEQLKQLDPDGNLTLAFIFRDEYCKSSIEYMQVVNGKDFHKDWDFFLEENEDAAEDFKRKKKILEIVIRS